MPFPFIPAVILALTGGAYWKVRQSNFGIMTPDRQQIYDAALKNLKDPIKLRTLAASFEKEGCRAQADLLRKRAQLREMSPELKSARHTAFQAAMYSVNTEVISRMANVFDSEGATGAAEALRKRIVFLQSPEGEAEILARKIEEKEKEIDSENEQTRETEILANEKTEVEVKEKEVTPADEINKSPETELGNSSKTEVAIEGIT